MGDFSTSGAAQGAAAGSAFGPWGTVIGGVAGGFLGGGQDNKPPAPVALPVPNQTPNVSGVYGGMYRDPITGQISFTDTSYNPNFFQQYQNQALMNQILGGQGQTGNPLAGVDTQIGLLNSKIQGLQNQMGQKIDMTNSGLLPEWVDANGKLKPLDQILGEANNNSSWLNKQYLALGGHYGKGGFAQFIKDAYARNIQPAYDKYQKDLNTQKSSNDLIQQQIDALKGQLSNYNEVKSQFANQGQGQQAPNPMTQNLQGMDDIAAQMRQSANSGAYLQQAQGQIGNQMQNAISQAENDAARRGLSGSSISEMMKARLGLEGAQALNQANYQQQQNSLAALGQAQGATNQALQARLGLAQGLQGIGNTTFNQGLQQQQLNLGQLQLGAGVGANNASALNGQAMGNAALQNQYNMGVYNAGLANQMQNQNNWGQAAGALGYGAQQYMNQPNTNYYQTYGGQNAQAPTTGSQNTWGMGTTGQGGFNFGDAPATTTNWSAKLGGNG